MVSAGFSADECYEIVSFSYKDGVSFEAQKDSMESLSNIISGFKGFKSRKFFHSEESKKWLDLILWDSMENAKAASEQVMANPEAQKAFSLMDETSIMCSHYGAMGGTPKA